MAGSASAITIQLTTSWSVFASYEHFWTPSLRTSLYGSYLEVSRNAAAAMPRLAATASGASDRAGVQHGLVDVELSARARQWNVTKDFYVGLDVIYSKLNTASINGGLPYHPDVRVRHRTSGWHLLRRPTRTGFGHLARSPRHRSLMMA